jgi:putative transposase
VSLLIASQQNPLPIAPLLQALGLNRATYYRSRIALPSPAQTPLLCPKEEEEPAVAASQTSEPAKQPDLPAKDPLAPSRCRVPGRALTPQERAEVYRHLYAERFLDRTVQEIWATLLDEDIYLCSRRTLYRLLAADRTHTKRTRTPRNYTRPELLATRVNQLWSWDITKLKGPASWTYFHLYVMLDVYSRCVVGWMVAYQESQELAQQFIAETLVKQNISPGQLTVHADRGSAMTSKSVALLLSDLGVVKTHSRPHVSNDNPYSEAQFKTLKYRPEFPERFATIEEARTLVDQLIRWYNGEHHHGGIALLTPHMVHTGQAEAVIARRQTQLDGAYAAHPERFVNSPPKHASLPEAVWINPPVPKAEEASALRNAVLEGKTDDRQTTRTDGSPSTTLPAASGADTQCRTNVQRSACPAGDREPAGARPLEGDDLPGTDAAHHGVGGNAVLL